MRHDIGSEFERQGYCIVEDAFGPEEVAALRREAIDVCLSRRGPISCGAGAECRTVADVNERVIAVHFPHKVSPLFRAALSRPVLAEVLQAAVGPDVKCMQSMVFMKGAGMPGQAWHQDEAFIPTEDRSLVGAWIALDDATVRNGCLWVVPGSHRAATLWPMRAHGDPRFDDAPECFGFPFGDDDAVAVELRAGSVVFFHGYLLHRSLPNESDGYRRSLVNHYMSAGSRLAWSGGIEANRRADYRDVVMVCGEDPHAAQGLEDLSVPYYRTRDGHGRRDGQST